MIAPTYPLRSSGCPRDLYRRNVARLADEVLAAGAGLHPIVDAYGAWVEETGRERRRSEAEYLLEALTLGVLWRARGADATRRHGVGRGLLEWLARWRRADGARPRDGSTRLPLSVDASYEPGHPCPTLRDLDALLTWLVASGEYDEEVARLEGWEAFLRADFASADETLEQLVAFAVVFEGWSEHALGVFTEGAERSGRDARSRLRWPEEPIACPDRRVEVHLSMLGAELLNRVWRDGLLGAERPHDEADPTALDLRELERVRGARLRAARAAVPRAA